MDNIYIGLRREVSLLLANGHTYARQYPLIAVWNEARIVRQRIGQRDSTNASLMLSAIQVGMSCDKKAMDNFKNLSKRMLDE